MNISHKMLRASGQLGIASFIALLSLQSPVRAESDQKAPPTQKVGEGTAIAAWPPPAALKADPRILDTLTKEIYLQPGKEFGVVDDKNQPLRPVPTNDWWSDLIMNGDGGQLWQFPMVPKVFAQLHRDSHCRRNQTRQQWRRTRNSCTPSRGRMERTRDRSQSRSAAVEKLERHALQDGPTGCSPSANRPAMLPRPST